MAVAIILSFFILLIGGMFLSGGIAVSAMNVTILAAMLAIGGMALYEMYKVIHADE